MRNVCLQALGSGFPYRRRMRFLHGENVVGLSNVIRYYLHQKLNRNLFYTLAERIVSHSFLSRRPSFAEFSCTSSRLSSVRRRRRRAAHFVRLDNFATIIL